MNCLAILNSGNYSYSLCRYFEKKGHVFEVVNMPCQIAKTGCTYCLKYPEEFTPDVINAGKDNGTPVKEIYKVIPGVMKNKYEKIF